MNGNGEEVRKRILECLKEHPEGLTIQNLSRILGMHRQTAAKYVLVLEATGEIVVRRIGAISLCYLKETFIELKRLKR